VTWARMVWAVFVALTAATALTPTDALAQRAPGRGHGGGGGSSTRVGAHHFAPGSFGSRSHFHHGFGHQGGFVVFAPPLWYGPDPYYYPPVAYDPGTAYAPPTYGTASLAPPPPMPSVVQYPTGRYELRGDGFTTPYQWIWIPNPPAAPPAPPPPAVQSAPSGPPAPTKPEPPGNTTVYRWTDAQGVLHLTDRLDSVPPPYRTRAKSTRAS
jgi:uncharacterized protein DUF4124